MKIGDLVEFSYGRVGGQIDGIGIYAGITDSGTHKVLFAGKAYELREQFIRPLSVQRSSDVNEVLDN
jgi:hypothetical protein